ncbi:hypothetical protein [Singulisphaera sp. GP187]|uniref:hypothetical protein n=1 Tax=Singulisphaera sp. GP187 TaxID=1882752 RepID=UPI000940BBF8|nr:hypothetical protein [Singulisphaera sp. GP187]
MRLFMMAASFLGLVSVAGCGGSSSATNPNDLPPLSAADLEEVKQRDLKVEEEEKAQMLLTPKVKPTRSRAQ